MSVAVSVYALAWVSALRPDAFADHLRTSECGVAVSDDSLATLVANMGMPVGVAFVIAPAFANIAANTNALSLRYCPTARQPCTGSLQWVLPPAWMLLLLR